MTVIAAVAREGRVTIAADTASHQGSTRFASPPKIRRHGDVLLAAAGSSAIGPALRDPSLVPSCSTADLDEWAQTVAERITARLLVAEPSLVEEGSIQGELIVGYSGRLWYVDTNLATPAGDMAVIGSGSDVAYGALSAYLEGGADPLHAVTQAVVVACRRNAGCALVDGVPQVECA